MKRGIWFVVLLFFLFNVSFSSAIVGVSPPKYEVAFTPNTKQVFSFDFLGDEGVPMKIYLEGDLAQYAELSTNKLEGSGNVNVLLKLPDKIEVPGNHQIFVGSEQLANLKGGMGIVGGVRAVISVRVPAPGKYITADLKVDDARWKENVSYLLTINNQGHEQVPVALSLDVSDASNNSVETFFLQSAIIPSLAIKEFRGVLKTESFKPGLYLAKVSVPYGERTASAEDFFRIGELFVNISNYTRIVERGTINKFDVEVESHWNDPLENSFAEMELLDYGIRSKTASVRLEGFQKIWLNGYLDLKGIPGDVDKMKINLTVHYPGGYANTKGDISFKKEKESLSYILIAGIIAVAAAIVVAVLVFWRKRRKSE